MTRWPVMMLRKTAAEYLELSEAAFEREVMSGVLPAAIMLGGKSHWYRRELDKYLDQLVGAGGDWRAESKLYAA